MNGNSGRAEDEMNCATELPQVSPSHPNEPSLVGAPEHGRTRGTRSHTEC